jgi:glucose-6-phosphate 1-dehydrogenase
LIGKEKWVPHTLVIFGASGDLTSRKLIPALYELHRKGRLPDQTRIVGVSRTALSSDTWRTALEKTTKEYKGQRFDKSPWDEFASCISYFPADLKDEEAFAALAPYLDQLDGGEGVDRLFYLATHPALYGAAVERLQQIGADDESSGARRLVVEKPFGVDYDSAAELNRALHAVFREDQIYRIDHYLGKESVQNLFVLRFANTIFEPIWNRNYIDHVQITVAESVTVGSRAEYYDASGVVRDMIQNHLLQLMMITAMEAPVRFVPELVRNEKVKVLQSVPCLTAQDVIGDTIRGQYVGYTDEPDVRDESQTATFAAVKLRIDNWRWQGVPFYLRSGKAISCRTTQIVIQFRPPPHLLFNDRSNSSFEANRLVIQIQPAEGIQLHFQTKVPDAGMNLRLTDLDFRFGEHFAETLPDAYQRLLLDALNGDASLFARSDEVETAWKIVDPIISTWASSGEPPLLRYEPGCWGPEYGTEWMRAQGREWFDVCPVLH